MSNLNKILENIDFKSFNYIEIDILTKNILTKNIDDKNIIDVNWSKTDFVSLLNKIIESRKIKRPFEKQYRIMKCNNLIYSNNISDNKYNLFSTTYIDRNILDNKLLILYKKDNLPVFQFPSTNNYDDDYYTNNITFKITNLIYLNFEIKKKGSELYYRVYINQNNDKVNIDHTLIIKNIRETIQIIDNLLTN